MAASPHQVAVSVYSGIDSEHEEDLSLCQISPTPPGSDTPPVGGHSTHSLPLSDTVDKPPSQSSDPVKPVELAEPVETHPPPPVAPSSATLPQESAPEGLPTVPPDTESPVLGVVSADEEGPVDVVTTVVSNREYVKSKTAPPELTLVRNQRLKSSSSKPSPRGDSDHGDSTDFNPSVSIETIDPSPGIKFVNMLGKHDSDSPKVKPKVVRPSGQSVMRGSLDPSRWAGPQGTASTGKKIMLCKYNNFV